MKKLITLTILALTLSCSKEEGVSNLPVSNVITTSTLLGFWQPSQIIKADGSLQAYPHSCATKDFVEFYHINSLKETLHDVNCNTYVESECQQYQILSNGVMINCVDKYTGTYTLINSTTLKIEYDAVKNFPPLARILSRGSCIKRYFFYIWLNVKQKYKS